MAAQTIPSNELIDTSRYECVDGELVERPVPNFRHSRIQDDLSVHFRPLTQLLGMVSGPELSIDRNPGKSDWMTPDYAVSMPGGYTVNANGHALPPILLAVEVLSPGQSLTEMRQKAERYLAWGAQTVWLIDPDAAVALVFNAEQPGSGHFVAEGLLRAGDLAVSLAQILE